MLSIQNIWQKVLKGDRKAQKELYEISCEDLMNVCKRYLPDSSHLDAFQEAYIKIFTKSRSYNPAKGSLNAWMARIAVNECLLVLRKQKRMVLFDVSKNDIDPKVQDDIIADLSAEEIYKEVEKLPDGYRTVFNLYVVEGYSHNEIGELLGVSPSSSRSQLTRAKNTLRLVIKKQSNLKSYGTAK